MESATGTRHAITPKHDLHEMEKQKFARLVAHEINLASAQETGVPHAFGVLTCETLEQALDRAGVKAGNKGFEAAIAAIRNATSGSLPLTSESFKSKLVADGRKVEHARPGPRPASPKDGEDDLQLKIAP